MISLVAVLLWVLCARAEDLLIRGARVWDGRGGPAVEGLDLRVRGDRIVALEPGLRPVEGERVLDGSGATVIPGLVDAHVHLSLDPGARWREDDEATRDALLAAHLRAYLAHGVTTVLDPGVRWEEAARVRAALAAGVPGPRALHCGPPVGPPGGYVSAPIPEFPAYATLDDIEAHLDRAVAEGASCVKLTLEPGFAGPIWPLLAPELRRALADGARARGLPLYVHAMSEEEQELALELQPHALVHAGDSRSAAHAARVAASGAWVISTLSVMDGMADGFSPRRLRGPDPRGVPAIELETARSRAIAKKARRAMADTLLPGLPRLLRAPLARALPLGLPAERRRLIGNLRRLREAGAALVLGSDAGNWPLFTAMFHGPSTLHEAELLAEAGLSPTEVLLAATRRAAEMLGLQAEIGTLAPGMAADLVVVEGDPTADIGALRQLRWTLRAGVVWSPEALIAAGGAR